MSSVGAGLFVPALEAKLLAPCGQLAAQWPGWPHRKQLRLALALPFGSNFPPPCGGYLIVVEDLPDLVPPPFHFPLLLQPDGLVVGEVDEAGPCC